MYENENLSINLVEEKNKMDAAEARRRAIAYAEAKRNQEIAEARALRKARKLFASWFWLVVGWAICALTICATAYGCIPGLYGYPIACGFSCLGGILFGQYQEEAKNA